VRKLRCTEKQIKQAYKLNKLIYFSIKVTPAILTYVSCCFHLYFQESLGQYQLSSTVYFKQTTHRHTPTYKTNIIHATIITVTQFRRPVAVSQHGCAKNENRSSRRGTFKVHLIRQALYFSLYYINNYN
jgi:hypothetical protein